MGAYSIALASCGSAIATAVLAWLMSLEGTLGLYRWGYERTIFLGFGLLVALPPGLILVAALTKRLKSGKAAIFPARIAGGIGVLAMVCSLSFSCAILAFSIPKTKSLPRLTLVEPNLGLLGSALTRDTKGEPGPHIHLPLSSDPHFGSASSDAPARSSIVPSIAASFPPRDAFFILGDHVEIGMFEKPWIEEVRLLSELAPGLPVLGLMGNHDALANGQSRWRQFWQPSFGNPDSPSPYFYSFEAGPISIVVIHLLWGAESFGSVQAAWLERTLSCISPERPVIVLSHAFAYASGYLDPASLRPWYDEAEVIARVVPILEAHGVELMISGHNHYLEFLEHNGVAYAIIGAMGGKPDPSPSYRSPASRWISVGTYGYLDIDADSEALDLSFRDKSGRLLHHEEVRTRP
jgi:hypothetical protein